VNTVATVEATPSGSLRSWPALILLEDALAFR